MTEKFYCSFKEFNDNFDRDFTEWLNLFSDAEQRDYLHELKELYEPFVRWSGNYRFKEEFEISFIDCEYPEYKQIDIVDYERLINEKINVHLQINNNIETTDLDYLEFWDDCNRRTRENSIYFDDNRHSFMKRFFKNGLFGVDLDEIKYKNFKFSVVKIAENIDARLADLRTTKIANCPEPADEDEIALNKFSTPEKIALLELLDLDSKIDNVTGNIAEHIYRLLGLFFGVSANAIK